MDSAQSELLAVLLAGALAKFDRALLQAPPEALRGDLPNEASRLRAELFALHYAATLFALSGRLGAHSDSTKLTTLNLHDLLRHLAITSGSDAHATPQTSEGRREEAQRLVYAVSRFESKIDQLVEHGIRFDEDLRNWGAAALGTSGLEDRFTAYRACWGYDGIESSIKRIGAAFAGRCGDAGDPHMTEMGERHFRRMMAAVDETVTQLEAASK
jgi:hypothetical protein